MKRNNWYWLFLIISIGLIIYSLGFSEYYQKQDLLTWALVSFGVWVFWVTWPKVLIWKHLFLILSTLFLLQALMRGVGEGFHETFWGVLLFGSWTVLSVWRSYEGKFFWLLALSGISLIYSIMNYESHWIFLSWGILFLQAWVILSLRGLIPFLPTENRKQYAVELTPEIKDVFDSLLGKKAVGGNFPCIMCGGLRKPEDGYMCAECADFSKKTVGFSKARCGGCGAGFLVAHKLDPICIKPDGIERVICACCMEHIKTLQPEHSSPQIPQGYDDEGQQLNIKYASESLATKLNSRRNQDRILKTVEFEEKRKGLKSYDPVFVSRPNKKSDFDLNDLDKVKTMTVQAIKLYDAKEFGNCVRVLDLIISKYEKTDDSKIIFLVVQSYFFKAQSLLFLRRKEEAVKVLLGLVENFEKNDASNIRDVVNEAKKQISMIQAKN